MVKKKVIEEVAQVEDKKDLIRDLSSKAVINKNKQAYVNAKMRKKQRANENKEKEALKDRITQLESLVQELINKTAP